MRCHIEHKQCWSSTLDLKYWGNRLHQTRERGDENYERYGRPVLSKIIDKTLKKDLMRCQSDHQQKKEKKLILHFRLF